MKKLLIAIRKRLGTTQMARRFYRLLPSGKRCNARPLRGYCPACTATTLELAGVHTPSTYVPGPPARVTLYVPV